MAFGELMEKYVNTILSVLSSHDKTAEDKKIYVDELCEELSRCGFVTSSSDKYRLLELRAEELIADKRITELQLGTHSAQEYENAIALCDLQKKRFAYSLSEDPIHQEIKIKIKNWDLEQKKKEFAAKREEISHIELLKDVSEHIRKDLKSGFLYSDERYLEIKHRIEEYETAVNKELIYFPLLRDQIPRLPSKELLERLETYRRIGLIDGELSQIQKDCITRETSSAMLKKIADVEDLLALCYRRKDPMPAMHNHDLGLLKEKYSYYYSMINYDQIIMSYRNKKLDSEMVFKQFESLCQQQDVNIKTCSLKRWPFPSLTVTNPRAELEAGRERRKTRKNKKNKIQFAIVVAALLVLSLAVMTYYFSLYGSIPLSSSKIVLKMNYDEISKILNEEGFTNVTIRERSVETNYPPGTVLVIQVDGDTSFDKGDRYRKDAPIYLKVCDDDRCKIPIKAEESVGMNFQDTIKAFRDAGFVNVLTEDSFESCYAPGTVLDVKINGKNDFDSEVYARKDSEVRIIKCDDNRVDISGVIAEWERQNRFSLRENLVVLDCKVESHSSKTSQLILDNKIFEIIVGGERYIKGDCFVSLSSKVEIHYYSSQILIYQGSDELIGEEYAEVYTELRKQGFTNIKIQRLDDLDNYVAQKDMDRTIKTITIDGKKDFDMGASFGPSSHIVIYVHTYPYDKYDDMSG